MKRITNINDPNNVIIVSDAYINGDRIVCITEEDEDWHVGKWSDDAIDWLEKQKEQEHICDSAQYEEGFKTGLEIGLKKQKEQKENPKSADSIPSDCVSDVKCENSWHKVADSLPDNGRLVLAQDCLGNTLLARYDGEGNWEVSVYDNDDYYCRNTITKWCEIPSEKQKEQKPWKVGANAYFTPEQKPKRERKKPKESWLEKSKYELEHADELLIKRQEELREIRELKNKEQKPAEWSEEDEENFKWFDKFFRAESVVLGGKEISQDKYLWFKSLRPQPKQEWSEDWREEDIQTRFAFYTYKDDPSVLYLSNVFVEETSRNHGFGTRILRAAEKVAETIGATTISLKVKQDSPANAWYRKNGYGYVAFEDGHDWLEKNLEYMKPNKQEWSEEDEKMRSNILNALTPNLVYTPGSGTRTGTSTYKYDKEIAWLKSLRPQWRPSEEQVATLKRWLQDHELDGDSRYVYPIFYSLFADLQKLL